MKINEKDTTVIRTALERYYNVLYNKKGKSPEELNLFNDLKTIMVGIEQEQKRLDNINFPKNGHASPSNCTTCED